MVGGFGGVVARNHIDTGTRGSEKCKTSGKGSLKMEDLLCLVEEEKKR